MIELIAFDADDTLWHNETIYMDAQSKYRKLLEKYHEPGWVDERLYQTEMRNLGQYGYGIKSFILSMIETAIELTDGQISGAEIQQIIDLGKGMLNADIRLLDHVRETVASLSESYDLMVITKGDLLDQESKIDRSGLGDYFRHVEVVSDKTAESYRALLERHGIEPVNFLMVGNSLKSDILPILELGGTAVFVPYANTWIHENNVNQEIQSKRYFELKHIGLLPDLVARLNGGSPH